MNDDIAIAIANCRDRRVARTTRRMTWHLLVAQAALALGLSLPMPGRAAGCAIKTMEFPVTMTGPRAIATVGINGKQVPMIVDTGAFYSNLTEAAAQQLDLPVKNAPFGLHVHGFTGPVDMRLTRVKSLQLLKGEVPNVEFLVGGNDFGYGAMGLLGRNLLSFTDVEYDLAHGVIRFVMPNDECDKVDMAYWAGETPVSSVELERSGGARLPPLRARAKLNGKDVIVMFDSGAGGASFVTLDTAKRVGVERAQMKPAGRLVGVGRGNAEQWTAPFATFELGSELIRNNRLRVSDVDGDSLDSNRFDMVLGIDFFLSHRIYVSQKRQRMFFTYNGGAVFALNTREPASAASAAASDARADAGPDADVPHDADGFARLGAALASRGDLLPALADYDRACELQPASADYRARRGMVHLALKQSPEARADFDEALRLDPTLIDARLQRAVMREAAGDRAGTLDDLQALDKALPSQAHLRLELARFYNRLGLTEQALPQWALWIASHGNDERLAEALNQRCWARAMLDIELDMALDDCDKAIDLKPEIASYRDSRGWVYVRLGKMAKAVDDFDRDLKTRPTAAWSLFGRGIARTRLGDVAQGQADLAAARKASPNIDAEAARHGIAASQGPAAAQ